MRNKRNKRNKRKLFAFSRVAHSLIVFLIAIAVLSSCAGKQTLTAPNVPAIHDEVETDIALQKAATEALGELEGTVVVIDPQTGRLRAVVNPRLAFEQSFPPGSAIKPFTALAAMRAGFINRDTRFAHAGYEIVCSHPKSKFQFDTVRALAYSCNDFFAQIGERMSEGPFNATLSSFGFGARTGVNASESAGSLPRGEWRVRTALGESDDLLVTPIQLIAAYSALVNGGRLHRLQWAQRVNDRSVVATWLNIAPQHRAVIIEGMRGAVKYGTAKDAKLPFYVFGKTGTSTASNGFRTQGWFVGFAAERDGVPRADQVKLGVLVFLKRAHGSECGEVARKILDFGFRVSDDRPDLRHSSEASNEEEAMQLATYDPKSKIQNPKPIRVRSVTEKVTRRLPLEEYLAGVLAGESGIEGEFEALKAQAVVSRTYALRNLGRHAQEGFDFCSTTHCQRFVLAKTGRTAARRAVEETSEMVLTDNTGEIVDAYFHAACGGMTANIESLWGVPAPHYLRGVHDDFCAGMPHHRWSQTIPANRIIKALQSDERTNVGSRLDSITVNKRDRTGRVELLTLVGSRSRAVRGWDFKIIVGRSLGWQMIKSSRFDVSRKGSDFVFRGSGFGHGLGLCQEGSHVMAQRGMNYGRILGHYFPGTTNAECGLRKVELILKPPLSIRIQTTEHFRVIRAFGNDPAAVSDALRILETTRSDLMRRLENASLDLPENSPFEIVIHANTADFIAATGQSGWAAGVTRGKRIELQPLSLLQKRGMMVTTLRHELTHAFIEVLSRGGAPRWLSEGMAIHVAGEGSALMQSGTKSNHQPEELERRLARPVSVKEMRELYAAAYREVRALIQARGEAEVWRLAAKQR